MIFIFSLCQIMVGGLFIQGFVLRALINQTNQGNYMQSNTKGNEISTNTGTLDPIK